MAEEREEGGFVLLLIEAPPECRFQLLLPLPLSTDHACLFKQLGVVAAPESTGASGHPVPEACPRHPSFDAAEVFEGTVEQAFELAASAEQLVALLGACGQRYQHAAEGSAAPRRGEVSGGEDAGTPWRWILSDVAVVSEVDVIAYAKRKREMQGDVWTGEVARALGQFLALVRSK